MYQSRQAQLVRPGVDEGVFGAGHPAGGRSLEEGVELAPGGQHPRRLVGGGIGGGAAKEIVHKECKGGAHGQVGLEQPLRDQLAHLRLGGNARVVGHLPGEVHKLGVTQGRELPKEPRDELDEEVERGVEELARERLQHAVDQPRHLPRGQLAARLDLAHVLVDGSQRPAPRFVVVGKELVGPLRPQRLVEQDVGKLVRDEM